MISSFFFFFYCDHISFLMCTKMIYFGLNVSLERSLLTPKTNQMKNPLYDSGTSKETSNNK